MKGIYSSIIKATESNKQLLAILIDPDKTNPEKLPLLLEKVNKTKITHVLVGGSTVANGIMDAFVSEVKNHTKLPVLIFPGDITQITPKADGLLFLSLISGRDPEYLIEKQVQAVSKLRGNDLEVIPTGYILVENGKETTVQKVSGTKPISRNNMQLISDTAKAGELLGMKLVYLEAGSGAKHPINPEIIAQVKRSLKIPLVVGGGIRSKDQIDNAFSAGADLVVIGTAFEKDQSFFDELN